MRQWQMEWEKKEEEEKAMPVRLRSLVFVRVTGISRHRFAGDGDDSLSLFYFFIEGREGARGRN